MSPAHLLDGMEYRLELARQTDSWRVDEVVGQADVVFMLGHIRSLYAKLARAEDECKVWMNAVADAVESLGYDREAACGPADLLPGLDTLVRLASE